jgi:hypothetical protein
MLSLALCPIMGYLAHTYIPPVDILSNIFSKGIARWILTVSVSYLGTYIDTLRWSKCGGLPSKFFQRLSIWNYFKYYFSGQVNLEEPLDHDQIYIFCCFPHGACTFNQFLTMTDCCSMLSKHYKGERRDLAASVLMYIPIVKDVRNSKYIVKYNY